VNPAPGICGIDEAGRGPWAGPVVAGAVILTRPIPGLDDSKKLSPARRAKLFDQIVATAIHGIGLASVEEIDRLNILQASFLAMRRAVAALGELPRECLVDGKLLPPGLPAPARAIVGGDALEPAISAASILAKVTRDRIMAELSHDHPGYGWESNMGYGVPAHLRALKSLGVTPHHRRSFRPIHNILCNENSLSH
jgi:ribonuclease HII